MVVEYVNGEMLVAETNIVTNHYLADSPKKGVGDEESHARFDLLNKRIGPDFVLAGGSGGHQRPFQEVRALVAPVSQSQKKFWYPQAAGGDNDVTLWSIVYAPGKQWADFYFREDFDHGHRLFLHPALVDPFVREINNKNKFVSPTPVIYID